jgi:hypothetical protein
MLILGRSHFYIFTWITFSNVPIKFTKELWKCGSSHTEKKMVCQNKLGCIQIIHSVEHIISPSKEQTKAGCWHKWNVWMMV